MLANERVEQPWPTRAQSWLENCVRERFSTLFLFGQEEVGVTEEPTMKCGKDPKGLLVSTMTAEWREYDRLREENQTPVAVDIRKRSAGEDGKALPRERMADQ
jgi:hypothetical protein